MNWYVDPEKANQLNLRKGPKPAAVIATLPAGTNVTRLNAHATNPVWWEVEAVLGGATVRGYLSSRYLGSGTMALPQPAVNLTIPEAHLRGNAGKTRRMNGGRAFPLDEPGMPGRPNRTAAELIAIIDYLDPGNGNHRRYKAGGGNTFCNIYAYDYCQRCEVYMPRVWWTDSALDQIRQGQTPQVAYGTTVRELNANMLHDWFIDYGAGFGWSRTFDATDLQDAANSGGVGIIVAKRVNLARSGHIVAVVPEHDGIVAARSGGSVTRPVQSQAGSTNFRAKATSDRWWAGSRFQSFGFWIHD